MTGSAITLTAGPASRWTFIFTLPSTVQATLQATLQSTIARGAALLATSALLVACGNGAAPTATEGKTDGPAPAAGETRTLTIGAYTTPREVLGKEILPAFRAHWKQKTGQDVKFETSYQGSGSQARAIVGGFEADIAFLSLEPDMQQLVKANLITHDWKNNATKGIVTQSVVALAVREGNPKQVQGWDDLRKPGLEVLTPNVKTSGGAMWNVAALYGAALRGGTSAPKGDPAAAENGLTEVLKNVSIMDKGARESMVTFERGVGDVAITYENEVLVGKKGGQKYDLVIPSSTILIENPIALVDVSVDKHKNRDLAEAFLAFVQTPEAQRQFAAYGLRPVDATVAKELENQFPQPTDLFTIRDLGDWAEATKTLFSPEGAYARALEKVGTK